MSSDHGSRFVSCDHKFKKTGTCSSDCQELRDDAATRPFQRRFQSQGASPRQRSEN